MRGARLFQVKLQAMPAPVPSPAPGRVSPSIAERRRERRRVLSFEILPLVADARTDRQAAGLPRVLQEEAGVVLRRRARLSAGGRAWRGSR